MRDSRGACSRLFSAQVKADPDALSIVPNAGFASTFERIRSDASWKTYTVDCGHDVMIDKPDELTRILVGLT